MSDKRAPELSVVIPVYNEQESLDTLFKRLYPALDALGREYEVIFVDDGSADRSAAMLREQFGKRDDATRVVLLQSNFGQHAAILAGFEVSRGDAVVTLDADLQNPPEEIGNLLKKMDEGYDYVGTIRRSRRDVAWRKYASRAMNRLRERITKVKMTDQGCMLRAYSRHVIDAINNTSEINTFIPALAYLYALKPVEIEVEHNEREAGESKYSLYKLIRLNFDLVTGFSVVPLQVFSFFGVIIAAGSFFLFLFLVLYRILYPEGTVQGVFTLFALAFFFIGILLFGIGLLGEYVGRIYQEVQRRPRFLIRSILEKQSR
ncbi:MAG TPA: glycosyltransferase [Gammaproteobacteria bacterium]|jgi:undecaprenyl-phosphate 4-deoxy-4-formamido-L-arabinose transferase|nr:glycosyltransferase [Gammaproteobacteria bacterium]